VNVTFKPLLRRAARVRPVPPGPLAGRPPEENPTLDYYGLSESSVLNKSKLSTTDLLVLASMKNAAKCDK
jgi:hypothetical protein